MNIKSEICKNILSNTLDKNKILYFVNSFLNNSLNEDDGIIELYINHDKLNEDTIRSVFLKSIKKVYGISFSPESCLKYIIMEEIEKILDNKISYYDGFYNIEEFIKLGNRIIQNIQIDPYGAYIDNELGEIMHDFDLTTSLYFSKYDNEELIKKKINKEYLNSRATCKLKKIIYNLRDKLSSPHPPNSIWRCIR